MPRTLYEVLEVSETASVEAIRSAYRRLARKHHPDSRHDPDEERFKTVQTAWDVLGDAQARKRYDEELAAKRQSRDGDGPSQPTGGPDAQEDSEQHRHEWPDTGRSVLGWLTTLCGGIVGWVGAAATVPEIEGGVMAQIAWEIPWILTATGLGASGGAVMHGASIAAIWRLFGWSSRRKTRSHWLQLAFAPIWVSLIFGTSLLLGATLLIAESELEAVERELSSLEHELGVKSVVNESLREQAARIEETIATLNDRYVHGDALELCNHSGRAPLSAAIAWEDPYGNVMVRGWWNLGLNECKTIQFHSAGERVYVHAHHVSDSFWLGRTEATWGKERSFCTHGGAFMVRQYDAVYGNCTENGGELKWFSSMERGTPKWTFE